MLLNKNEKNMSSCFAHRTFYFNLSFLQFSLHVQNIHIITKTIGCAFCFLLNVPVGGFLFSPITTSFLITWGQDCPAAAYCLEYNDIIAISTKKRYVNWWLRSRWLCYIQIVKAPLLCTLVDFFLLILSPWISRTTYLTISSSPIWRHTQNCEPSQT